MGGRYKRQRQSVLDYQKSYRVNNANAIRDYYRRYYLAHKTQFRARAAAWEAANRDRIALTDKAWRERNLDRVREYGRRHAARVAADAGDAYVRMLIKRGVNRPVSSDDIPHQMIDAYRSLLKVKRLIKGAK